MKRAFILSTNVALLTLGFSAFAAAPNLNHCTVTLGVGLTQPCQASQHFPPSFELRSNEALQPTDSYNLQCSTSAGKVISVNLANGLSYETGPGNFSVSGSPATPNSTFIATVYTDSDNYTIEACTFTATPKK